MEESTKIETKSQFQFQDINKSTKLIKSQAQNGNQKGNQCIQQFKFTEINDVNPISLLKKPGKKVIKIEDVYKQCFQFLLKMGGQQLQNQNYETSLKFYQKCLEMMDIGRNIINKEAFDQLQYIKILIFANMACGYLNTRKLQKCSKYCEKAIQQIQKFLIQASKQIFLKIGIIEMILKFQHCAILSQLQQHQRSLELCKSNLVLIKKYLQIMDIFVRESLKSSYQKRKSNETVQFSRQVYKFAASTIKQLLQYIDQPMLKKQQMVFYYWQKNPQKNQEQLIKRFIPLENQNCKRSILGVSKKTHWIDQFNIGSVMHMTPLSLGELKAIFPVEQYLFKDKLYQIAIYCSMCYFTMATQTRFIDSNIKALSQNGQNANTSTASDKESDDKSIRNQSLENAIKNQNLGNLKIMKKYGYCEKTQMFKRSEVYHLCSIDVMSKIVKYAIPYINHIVKSYQKHYIKQKNLDQIVAIIEESFHQQDTIINQSIAQYLPYQNKPFQNNSIIKIQENSSFSKIKKNSHLFDSETQLKGFQDVISPPIMKNNSEKREKGKLEKVNQQLSNSNSQSFNENSSQYLQSVVQKKKNTNKSSRSKDEKPSNTNSTRNNHLLVEEKDLKGIKKKINSEKSPNPLGNPPKPALKKKKA